MNLCVGVCVCSVTQSCLTLCNPMDCSPPGFSVHGISQARILEQAAISSSRGSFQPGNWTHISCIGRQILYHWATWEAQWMDLLVNELRSISSDPPLALPFFLLGARCLWEVTHLIDCSAASLGSSSVGERSVLARGCLFFPGLLPSSGVQLCSPLSSHMGNFCNLISLSSKGLI